MCVARRPPPSPMRGMRGARLAMFVLMAAVWLADTAPKAAAQFRFNMGGGGFGGGGQRFHHGGHGHHGRRPPPPKEPGRDFYKILGVNKRANEKEIKSAYKKLAMKYHPDKNPDDPEGAAQKFQDVAAAYEVLGDDEKRRVYDMGGEEGVKQQAQEEAAGAQRGGGGFGGPGGDPFRMFEEMFGGGGMGGGGFRQQQQRQQPQGPLYDKASGVTNLRADKFPDASAKHVWMVEFYAPWCQHCQRMKPEYVSLARELKGYAKVGAVDCTAEEGLCAQHGVKGYPTLKLFYEGGSVPYDGERVQRAMKEFVLGHIPGTSLYNVRQPRSLGSLSAEAEKKSAKVAAVYLVESESASALGRAVSFQVRKDVAFGESRGAKVGEGVAAKLGVNVLPQLVVLCGGDVNRRVYYADNAKGAKPPDASLFHPDKLASYLSKFADPAKCSAVKAEAVAKPKLPADVDFSTLRVKELRSMLEAQDVDVRGLTEKSEFVAKLALLRDRQLRGGEL